MLVEFAFPVSLFTPPLHCPCLQKQKDHPQENPKPNQPKNSSSYIPGCAAKGCLASKSEDIYTKLPNARNQVETYCRSPTCKPWKGLILPAVWESGKPGCTKLLDSLFVQNSWVALVCFSTMLFDVVIPHLAFITPKSS